MQWRLTTILSADGAAHVRPTGAEGSGGIRISGTVQLHLHHHHVCQPTAVAHRQPGNDASGVQVFRLKSIHRVASAGRPCTSQTQPTPQVVTTVLNMAVDMTGDRAPEQPGAGITEDAPADPSGPGSLRVVMRSIISTFRGQCLEIERVARQAGVQHGLDAHAPKAEDRVGKLAGEPMITAARPTFHRDSCRCCPMGRGLPHPGHRRCHLRLARQPSARHPGSTPALRWSKPVSPPATRISPMPATGQ